MTLLQAIANAAKTGLKISHPLIEGGTLLALSELECLSIPVAVAASNTWELEARTITVNEFTAKETMRPVLSRYVARSQVDDMADAIIAEFFTELS